jgi:hypothetical protein
MFLKVEETRDVQFGVVVVVKELNSSVKCSRDPHCQYTTLVRVCQKSSRYTVHTLCECSPRLRLG